MLVEGSFNNHYPTVGHETVFTTTLTTVADLSYTPNDAEQYRDSRQIKVVGRRSWKTLRGKGEAVWGPLLEATLIDALLKYHSCDENKPQPSKHGIRFPQRNQFISQYILEKTGKVRTQKQVGSRLQQMRETSEPPMHALISTGLSDLLLTRSAEPSDGSTSDSSPSPAAPPKEVTSDDMVSNLCLINPVQSSKELRVSRVSIRSDIVVYTILLLDQSPTTEIPRLHLTHNTFNSPTVLPLSLRPYSRTLFGRTPLSLPMFSNSVNLVSPWELNTATEVTVYYGREVARLTQVEVLRLVAGPDGMDGSQVWLYECDIASSSWRDICSAHKLTEVTILQKIIPRDTELLKECSAPQQVSIVYHFEVQAAFETVPVTSYEPHPQTSPFDRSIEAQAVVDAGQWVYQ